MINTNDPLAHLYLDTPPSKRINSQGEEICQYIQQLDQEFVGRSLEYLQAMNMAQIIDQKHFESIKDSYKSKGMIRGGEIGLGVGAVINLIIPQTIILRIGSIAARLIFPVLFGAAGAKIGGNIGESVAQAEKPGTV